MANYSIKADLLKVKGAFVKDLKDYYQKKINELNNQFAAL